MLEFYVRYGMTVKRVHEVISFKQSIWVEKYKNFITQRRNMAANDFGKDFYKLIKNTFLWKEKVRDRVKVEFNTKDDKEKVLKQQSKLPFNGIHKSYTDYDSFTFKQNEVLMDKLIYLGFHVLELSRLLMYET